MNDGLSATFPTRLRVRGSVVLFQQRISLRLFVGGGLSLIGAALLWLAGMPPATAATLLAVAVTGLFLTFEISWGGRSALRWVGLAVQAVMEPRVLVLQPTRVTLTAATVTVRALPVRWADAATSGQPSVERRRDATR